MTPRRHRYHLATLCSWMSGGCTLVPFWPRRWRRARDRGLSLAMVGWNGLARGLFVFTEQWRPGVDGVLESLRRSGLDVGVLTGDHQARGDAIARELGVEVEANLLPDQKVAAVAAGASGTRARRDGRRRRQ